MKPRSIFPGSNLIRTFCLTKFSKRVVLAAMPLLAVGAYATAQQPGDPNFPQYGYGYGSQNQPAPPQGYSQSQYAEPQYAQPEYQQPQYPQQPQQYGYQQPYAAPVPQTQPYGARPYGDQPDTQPYEQQPYGQPAPDEAYAQPGDKEPDAEQPYGEQQQPVTPQPPMSPDQLEQLVAPVALYPDALLAQILTASTYPAQVAVADQWLQQMQGQGYGSPDQIAAGANSQNWDPSVKALTAFPQVLQMLDQNLQWTTALGNAYYNQPQDVMQTVQVLRERAEQAGTLQNTPQESVMQDQGAIELAPPSPAMVYVPSYDPWTAYGEPISPYPGFSFAGALGSFFMGGGPLRFGAGIAMGAFQSTPWGWLAWGFDWLGHAVLFDHGHYFTYSRSVADWGFPRGGPRYGWDRGRWGGYGRGGYGYDRGGQRAWGRPRPEMRQAQPWGSRGGEGFNRSIRPSYGQQPYGRQGEVARGSQGFGGYGRRNSFATGGEYGRGGQYGGGYGRPDYSYGRMPQQAYNRVPYSQPAPMFSRGGYGYAARSYSSPYGGIRAPQQNYQRSFAERPSRGFTEPGRSSGFFGGGRAPKEFSGGHSFFGGHSSGGSFHAPKSYGGGGHFGGGHSGGGHSGGGGGHHHR